MPPKSIWFNGQLVPPDQAKVGVYDHGLLYGDGVFEGIRCYNGRVFKMGSHLRRLFDSAKAIRLTIPYSIDQLAEAIRQTLAANSLANGYIRLCVTRGEGTLGLSPNACHKPCVFIIADKITLYPDEYYQNGMAVIIASTVRNHPSAVSPRIKSLNYLNNILAKIEAIDAGLVEAVMLNHLGFVAECTGDNIFIIRYDRPPPELPPQSPSETGVDAVQVDPKLRRAVLISPPSSAGALEGVTLEAVIHLARRAGIPCERRDLTRYDLYCCHEMFLTGTAAEIIPVTKVDGREIADGRPGPVTKTLTRMFHELVAHQAPED